MLPKAVPYLALVFSIGFGWFILAPLVGVIASEFGVPVTSALLIISAYGYTMAVLGLLAGYISARFTVREVLYTSAVLTFVGLLGRDPSPDFPSFLAFSLIAATAYPFAVAPVGSIAEAFFSSRPATFVGLSVGVLFLGMSIGSFLGPSIYGSLGLRGALLVPAVLSALSLALVVLGVKGYPERYKRSLRGAFKLGMLKNWYIGLAIASVTVTLSSIGSVVMELHGLGQSVAISLGGLFGGLSLLGSALGAMTLPAVFEGQRQRLGLIIGGVLTAASAVLAVFGLVLTANVGLIALGYFLFGFFGNAYWSMALASTVNYVENPGEAGFATSMYSVVSNVGVAIIPVLLGGMFSNASTLTEAGAIAVALEVIAGALSVTLKVKR